MPVREYCCGVCRHRFGAPEGTPRDKRSLMCPACGSYDLTISDVERPAAPIVLRSSAPHRPGWWRSREREAS